MKTLASGSGGRSVVADLRLLVFAAVLPLLGVDAWGILDRLERDLEGAAAVAGRLARRTAADAERLIRLGETQLAAVGGSGAAWTRREACEAAFADFSRLSPALRGYTVGDPDGRILCAGPADATRLPPPAEANLPGFRVGNVQPDAAGGAWLVPMHYPLRHKDGSPAGSVTVGFDLAHFEPIASPASLPEGALTGLIDAAGRRLARAEEAGGADWTPPPALRDGATLAVLRGRGDGTLLFDRPDGAYHVGFARVADTDWLAFAVLPATPAYAAARGRAFGHTLVSLAALALALLLASLAGRRILRPLRRAARAARQAAAGDLGVRLAETGPAEVATVAAQFNRLLETVQAEQKQLRDSEARLHDVFDLSADWYWEEDAGQRLTKVEGNAYRAARVQKDVIGKRRWEIPGYAPLDGDWEDYKGLIARRETFGGRLFRQIAPDGRPRLLRVSGRPAYDARGEFAGYHGVASDVTEEMANRQAVLDSERKYRDLFDKNGRINLLVEPDNGRIVDASEAACAFFGHSRTALTLMTFERLGLRGETQALLRGRADEAGGLEFRFRPPGTNEVVLEAFHGPVRAAGRPVLFVTFHDITARKRAEDELRKLVRAVEQSPASIVITDTDGNIEYVNPRFEEVTGFARREVLGRNPRLLKSGRTPPHVYVELWRTIASGGEWRGELCNLSRRGELFWEQASISAVLDETGRVAHYIAVKENITERKRSEAAIRELNASLERRVAERTAELERANRELDAFSYSVSHDLRAPLRAINGFAHLIGSCEDAALGPESRNLLERIGHNAARMGELIDDLLRFARAGRGEPDRREVSLAETAAEALRELGEPDARAIVDIAPLPRLRCDRNQVRQVFANLIGNAVKYSSKRARPRIEIGCCEAADGQDAVFVRDNGAGFDPRYAQRLFGMFQRLHSDAEFAGTGVGLAICKRIVERHGGRIWAESAVDAGATFYFTLGEAARLAPPASRGRGPDAGPAPGGGG